MWFHRFIELFLFLPWIKVGQLSVTEESILAMEQLDRITEYQDMIEILLQVTFSQCM